MTRLVRGLGAVICLSGLTVVQWAPHKPFYVLLPAASALGFIGFSLLFPREPS